MDTTLKAFLSVRWWRGGDLDRRCWWWQRNVYGCANARCLCGAWLGSWRLDGAANGASKGGGSKGTTRGVVIGCLAPASRWCSGDDSDRLAQQGDTTPRWQCGLPVARKHGGRRRDARGSA
jgi:hypothetical protein